MVSNVLSYIKTGCVELFERAKCGDSRLSAMPTFVWTIGSAAIARQLVSDIFRRFIFRRVPVWEVTLQHLLFVWMIIYSLHFWSVAVQLIKFIVKYCYEIETPTPAMRALDSEKSIQQWMIWLCAVLPIALYMHIRPKPAQPPLMIWITTNHWHRREMGAYGYYLNRPPSMHTAPTISLQDKALSLRRAFSDSSRIVIKESLNLKKRRNSKSV